MHLKGVLDEREELAPCVDTVDLCLASLHFHPVYAGPAVRFRRYAPGLARRGVQTRVLTASRGSEKADTGGGKAEARMASYGDSSPPDVRFDRVDNIPVRRVRLSRGRGTMRGWWEYQRRMLDLCRDPDTRPSVLQLLSVDVWSTYYLYRIHRLGVPTVYTHTMLNTMSSRPWKRALQRIYWPLPYRFLDCTVVSSSVMRENLRNIGVGGRIEVIPNGTDMEQFHPASAREKRGIRRNLGLPEDDPIVLFVGSINPRKGVDHLLEAWSAVGSRHPRARLLLVGPRIDEIRPDRDVADFFSRLETILEEGSASERITFTGAVDDVVDYYRAADVFVFPSRKEGMPNVVPEAYACELPVVMTPFQGLPEEFGRAGTHHLLVDWNPGEIAGAISALLESPKRRRELGRAARKWAERELALETALDRYASLYSELAERACGS